MSGEPTFWEDTYAVCCERRMSCYTTRSFYEGCGRMRQRFWKCLDCGATTQSIDEVPVGLMPARKGPSRERVGGGVRGHGHGRHRRH